MSFESEMTGGYPTEADIDAYLAARGLEIPTENNPDWVAEFKQYIWGLLNAIDWATVLGVYAASSTTFNVREGSYLYKGEVKTYSAGAAVDPTDNDTTYVWLLTDNSISSGIDGDGWPTAEHVKLAEIDVNSSGIITAIRDLRGKALAEVALPSVGTSGGISFLLKATLTAGSTVTIHNANAPFKYEVVDAWSVAKSADGGTWKVDNGTNDISDAVTVTGTDKTLDRAGTIDDAYCQIAAAGSLRVVGDGSLADADVYIHCVRVS